MSIEVKCKELRENIKRSKIKMKELNFLNSIKKNQGKEKYYNSLNYILKKIDLMPERKRIFRKN